MIRSLPLYALGLSCLGIFTPAQATGIDESQPRDMRSSRPWYSNKKDVTKRYLRALEDFDIQSSAVRGDGIVRHDYSVAVKACSVCGREVVEMGSSIEVRFDKLTGLPVHIFRDELMAKLLSTRVGRESTAQSAVSSIKAPARKALMIAKKVGIRTELLALDEKLSKFSPLLGCWELVYQRSWQGISFMSGSLLVDYHPKHGILSFQQHRHNVFVPPQGPMLKVNLAKQMALKYGKRYVKRYEVRLADHKVAWQCELRKLIVTEKYSSERIGLGETVHAKEKYQVSERVAWVAAFGVEPKKGLGARGLLVIFVDAENGRWIGVRAPFNGMLEDVW